MQKVRPEWHPELHKFMPLLDGNTGIEDLTISFRHTPYAGHFKARHRAGAGPLKGWLRGP